ncbi:hypothetical protein LJC68_05350 [Bacteroidales bacterium OttesenSCG-928-B11]|nr:hypothetical protein [Bacteroidales bacterium OttesenSCG-928-B11]MDL2326368.1 hypothetical protein [Bacteroidales bacterium OttesenSCG-928-A14]
MVDTEKKNKTISGIITTVVMILLIILMMILGLKYEYPPPPPKQVIVIEMTSISGGGGGGGNTQSQVKKPTPSAAENLVTQPDIDLPVIPTSKKPNANRDVVEAPKDPEPVANPLAAYRPGMGGGTGGGTGSGTGNGLGSGIGPGEGSGTGGGIGYGTGGRGHLYMPDLTISETGQVYVEVHVETDGTVRSARVINTSKYPTTITNAKIREECVRKAYTAKYKPGKEELRIIVFK